MSKPPNNKPSTLYDVARIAGVSHITVSRVANGKDNVSPETRDRVLEAMQALGYVPNAAAQTLHTGRTRVIELLTTDIFGLPPGSINNIAYTAQDRNFQLSLLPTTFEKLYDDLAAIPKRMVAGTILYAEQTALDYGTIRQLTKDGPFVQLSGKMHSSLPSVTYDQFYAARLATQHLIDLGHQQIGHIAGQQNLFDGTVRYEGWLHTLQSNHLSPGPVFIGDFSEDSGYAAIDALLAQPLPFTALFVASDAMAHAAIYNLQGRGIRVPEDISIIGYNNATVGRFIRPNLTTVSNDIDLLGALSIEYLLEQIDNPKSDSHQRVLTPELIIRASTQRRG